MPDLHGILVVDKPAGMTSAHVVARVKRLLGASRVGHAGTLDPMATGVLPLALGEGTKLAGFLLADDKAYEGELELGVTTDTLDAEGQVTGRAPWEQVTRPALEEAMARLRGAQRQVPPMVSALKRGGERLYHLARRGVEVDLEPRDVRIARLELTDWSPPRARFVVECSKGTYVRALVRDLGAALACGATLTALRRTRSGRFALADVVPLDQVGERAAAALVSLADAVAHLATVRLDAARARDVAHGRRIPPPADVADGTRVRLLTPEGALAAIGDVRRGQVEYLRVFHAP